MFLYGRNGQNIDVYNFTADKNTLVEYRRKIMKGKNNNDLFYKFETTNKTILQRFLNGDELDVRFLNKKYDDVYCSGWRSALEQDLRESSYLFAYKDAQHQELIERYINGEFSNVIPTRTFIPDGGVDCYLKNYLVTTEADKVYSNIEKRVISRLENILELPNELCTLQLLENGRFSQILSRFLDFSEQIKLFDVTLVDSLDEKQIEKMFLYKLLDGEKTDFDLKVNTTEKILKKTIEQQKKD